MKPVRKNFHAQPDFPYALTFRDTKSPQRELPDHLHDWYELVYVHSGKGSFFIDRTIYEMREGMLFIIPGNTIHRALPDKDEPVTSTAIFFSPLLVEQPSYGESFSYLQCFEQSRKNRNYKLECSRSLRTLLETCINNIEEEHRREKIGSRHAILLITQQLLLTITRESVGETKHKGHGALIGPIWMRDSLVYIDLHFTEDIGLRKLCILASVSPAHFSRVFKQFTGMNVTAFIIMKRMIRAKELLLEKDDNIATIASSCGFETLPHFHRIFKKIVGVTPSAFRKRQDH